MVNWSYYDKFDEIMSKYLPDIGEGHTMAEQIVTCVSKLVYKWYNDGDVYDNTTYLCGWCNDLSCYANWLRKYVGDHDGCKEILDGIYKCCIGEDYEDLLQALSDLLLDESYLKTMERNKEGTIYDCDGPFEFIDLNDEEDCY